MFIQLLNKTLDTEIRVQAYPSVESDTCAQYTSICAYYLLTQIENYIGPEVEA